MASNPSKGTSFFNLPLSINRLNPRPTDQSDLWFSYEAAVNYAATDSTAYIGQILVVYDQTKNKKAVVPYVIDKDSTLKEIGSDGAGVQVVTELPGTSDSTLQDGAMVYLKPTAGKGKLYFLRANIAEDGTESKAWASIATSDDLENAGYGDMLKSVYDADGDGVIDVARSFSGKLTVKKADGSTEEFKGTTEIEISADKLGALTSIPIATSETTGGVKSSTSQDSVSVNADGTLSLNDVSASKIQGTVAEADVAGKVKSKLTITSADGSSTTFDGSSAVEISAESLGALTEVPVASTETAGIVKIGTGLSVDEEGLVSINNSELPVASTETAGIVKPGSDFDVAADGSLALAESAKYVLPTASTTVKGGVKVDGSTIISNSETISVGIIDGSKVSGAVAEATHANSATNYDDGTTIGGSSIKDALDSKLNSADLVSEVKKLGNVEGGFAALDSNKKISQEVLPSYVDDIIEGVYVNSTEFTVNDIAIILETGKIYVDINTNIEYRYTGTQLISIQNPLDYATDAEAAAMENDSKVMTPARVKTSIAAATINVSQLFLADGDTLVLDCGNSEI